MSTTLSGIAGHDEIWGGARPGTLAGLLAAGRTGRADTEAVVVDDDRRSYAELSAAAVGITGALVGLDVRAGDRVGLLSANTVEFVEALFGIALAGAVAVPLSNRMSADELRYAAELTGMRVLLVAGGGWRHDDDAARLVGEAFGAGDAGAPRDIVWLDRVGSAGHPLMADLRADVAPGVPDEVAVRAAAVSPDDIAVMVFTSGTESRPKAVMHSGRAIGGTALARWQQGLHHEPGDRVWIPTPLCHTAALVFMLGALGSGLTFVTSRWFDGPTAARLVERERCVTLWPQFPAVLQGLEDAVAGSDIDFGHVRQVAVVGTRAAFDQGERLFPNAAILSGYGSTELNAFISCPDLSGDNESRIGTSGRPFDGIEVAVVDPVTGTTLPDDVEGEIVVRGSCLFLGYFRNPEATAAAIDADGWFHTGDMGVHHATGTFAWTGRRKELLKVGGINLAPAEIEAMLLTVPGTRQAAVVGLPDAKLDEVPVAFVEKYPDTELTESELLAACRTAMASYKVPRHVWWVEPGDWPMSLTKVDKKVLAVRALELAARTGVSS
ncbi:AMP-binding protein [Nakamurella sp. YIM 132087]|uniref:AMP-binding protein n=1 Tax=Nakamurella alba TaxID=2665158 RepID=A0A7K1FIZ7_9ACTN|nr:class I adenylate-forming enzyme family protein [Nakamurella alba]MTD14046.1 AMP-binding protein [Nakamurella alba]